MILSPDTRKDGAVLFRPLMNDRKAPHLKAAAPAKARLLGNKQIRGIRCAHSFPRPSERPATPGTVVRQDLVVNGMTTRTGRPCERAEKIAQRTWRGQRHADSTMSPKGS